MSHFRISFAKIRVSYGMGDYWDHLLERVTGHSDCMLAVFTNLIYEHRLSERVCHGSTSGHLPTADPYHGVLWTLALLTRASAVCPQGNNYQTFNPSFAKFTKREIVEEGRTFLLCCSRSKFDPTHKREDEQKDELNEEDSKVEIIPGFSNEILDSKELNKRFQEKLAALRSKRKLADGKTCCPTLLTVFQRTQRTLNAPKRDERLKSKMKEKIRSKEEKTVSQRLALLYQRWAILLSLFSFGLGWGP